MIKKIRLLTGVSVMSLALVSGLTPAQAATIFQANFNSNDEGFTSSTYNPLGASPAGPWTYGATSGAGNSGGWSAGPEQGQGNPVEHMLTSSLVTLSTSGNVTLDFDHSYDFENGWDGGAVYVKLNGGSFTQVGAGSFTINGYTGIVQPNDDWGYVGDMNGLEIFTGTTTGFISSQANLGNFIAGDVLQIMFRGGWDWNGLGVDETRGWNIDNVTLSASPVPVPAAIWLFGSALASMGVFGRRKNKTV